MFTLSIVGVETTKGETGDSYVVYAVSVNGEYSVKRRYRVLRTLWQVAPFVCENERCSSVHTTNRKQKKPKRRCFISQEDVAKE